VASWYEDAVKAEREEACRDVERALEKLARRERASALATGVLIGFGLALVAVMLLCVLQFHGA
jgi:hypothetical protein